MEKKIEFDTDLLSKLDSVSKNPQIVQFVRNFMKHLSSHEDCTYLFGSAIWRLPLNEFDETQNDLDFLIYEDHIDRDKKYIMELCDCLGIELTKYEPVTCVNSYSHGSRITNRSNHIMVLLNDTFKIDLVYVKGMTTLFLKCLTLILECFYTIFIKRNIFAPANF